VGTIARASERLIPIKEEEVKARLTKYIDERQYRFPSIALSEAIRELFRLGEITSEMIDLSRQALLENNEEFAQRVVDVENELVNPLCAELERFINELMEGDLTKE
jgi:Na+/phosphate symporter